MEQNTNQQQQPTAPMPPSQPPTQPPSSPSAGPQKMASLPPISQVFHETMGLFKAKFLQYLKFYLLEVGAIILVIILLFATFSSFYSVTNASSSIYLVIVVFLGIFLYSFALMIISTFVMTKIVSEKVKIPLWEMIKQSLPFIFPLFWVNLLTGLAVLGGLVLLIIPGIIFAVLFMFITFTLILENKRGFDALKRSSFLVKPYFWPLLLRLLVIFLINLGVEIVGGIIPFGGIVIGPIIGWFTFVWLFVLYKHVTTGSTVTTQPVAQQQKTA